MKLTGKIFLTFSLFSIIITLFTAIFVYYQLVGYIRNSVDDRLLSAAKIIYEQNPELAYPDDIIVEGKNHLPAYQKKLDRLNVFADAFSFKYIYLIKPLEDGNFLYILSSEDNAEMSAEELFTIYEKPPEELRIVCETQRPYITKKVYTDEYGTFISGFHPIIEDGKVVAVLGLDYDASYLNKLKNRGLLLLLFVVLVTLCIFLPIAYISSKRIVSPIKELTNAFTNVGDGNFEVKYTIKGSDEIAKLGEAFNKTQDDVKAHIKHLKTVTAEKERLNSELAIASVIQKDMLPGIFPKFSGNKFVKIYASMMAAKEVGGDFYDFFYLDESESKISFVIADVSGKGVPAALFMVVAKTLIKQQMLIHNDPAQALFRVNEILCNDNKHDMFVTVFVCSLDLITGKITYANAGHNAPLISLSGRPYEFLKLPKGMPLGMFPKSKYKNSSIHIINGDKLYLYTDGISEAMNEREDQFGNERLLEAANQYISMIPIDFDMAIHRKIAEFIGSAMQSDDMTAIAVQYKGTPLVKVKSFDKELIVDASMDEFQNVLKWVGECVEEEGYNEHLKIQINVVVEEIFVNIARYAYGKGKTGKAVLRLNLDTEKFVMQFEDEGMPFNPLIQKDIDMTAGIQERNIGGLGIHLVKKWMDEVTYERLIGKNILTVYKFIRR